MKIRIHHLLLAACVALGSAACGKEGTWTGNGISPSDILILDGKGVFADIDALMVSTESDGESPLIHDAQGTEFRITAALASVDRIAFRLAETDSCGEFQEVFENRYYTCLNGFVRINGPFQIDLLTGQFTPSLGNLPVPLSNYQWMELVFEQGDAAVSPVEDGSPLIGRSIWVEGIYGDPEDGIAFELPVTREFGVRVYGPLSQPKAGVIDFILDGDAWLAGLPVTDCVDEGDLTVSDDLLVLENGTGDCSTLENDIVEAIEGSGSVNTD